MLRLLLTMNLLSALVATYQSRLPQTTTVGTENGNVVLYENGTRTTLTSSGIDTDATLSPDNSNVVFVRVIDRIKNPGELAGIHTELWVARRSERWRPQAFLTQPIARERARLQDFRYPRFSPDGKLIYFLVLDYSSVSPGLFQINMDGAIKFIAQALEYWVVPKGVTAGNLIVQQNRGLLSGGRINMYYMYDSAGQEIGIFSLYEKTVLDYLSEVDRQ